MVRAKAAAVVAVAGLAASIAAPIAAQIRVVRPGRPLTDRWQRVPVAPRGSTRLGISFRPLQAAAFGLDAGEALDRLLGYPIELVRLAAYWNRIESEPGASDFAELDRHVDAVEAAGRQIILCVGAVKAFGYPEYFVPAHHTPVPLPEGTLIDPASHRPLLDAACTFVARVVHRYRDRRSVVAWQVEHDAVDPLGMEHSWRLSTEFVAREIEAIRAADASRPVLMNGFLPTSVPVAISQRWRTRGQGDSLAVAQRLADIVGIDFYPRHAVAATAGRSVYLDGSRTPWQQGRRRSLFTAGRELMVCEGQAEPWEAVTRPPSEPGRGMYSCLPEHVIEAYNQCMRWNDGAPVALSAYLFWGAEYWLLRAREGDMSYLSAFERIVNDSRG
jgi:Beta-galactosidase